MLGHWGHDPLQGNPRYSSIRTLNHHGKTFLQLALDRTTGEKVAIRFTQRGWDEAQNKYLLRELLIHQELSACHHPHIVELKDVFLTPTHLAAVLEYVEGEDLQTFLSNTGGRVSEALGRFLFQQLVLALDFCHARGKVSRGVKLANTLLALSPGQLPLVKLADFGFSKDTGSHSAPASQVGTALFVPPEVMHNFNAAPYDGALVDVWASGIVLFMLLFGRHPCLRPEDSGLSEQQQMLALFTRTAASQFCLMPEEAAAISPGCADLLGHMLKTEPSQRYTMTQIQAHPWFKQGLPEGAALMNATILSEAATRPLLLKHPPESLAALVRHGQRLDPQAVSSHYSSSPASAPGPATAVNIPRSPGTSPGGAGMSGAVAAMGAAAAAAAAGGGRSGGGVGSSGGSGGAGVIAPRIASSSGQAGMVMGSIDEGGSSWGAPPPHRLLIHSCSSNDKATGLQYKKQEQQLLESGVVPPARFRYDMSESMNSSHGSFIGSQQQQQQRAANAQQEFTMLLESIPSAGLDEVLAQSPQQHQQHLQQYQQHLAAQQQQQQQQPQQQQQQQQPQQQFNIWTPQQGREVSTTTTNSSGGAVSAGACGAAAVASPNNAAHHGAYLGDLHSAPAGSSSGITNGGAGAAAPATSTASYGGQQQQQQQQASLLQNMRGLELQQQVQQQQAQLQQLQQLRAEHTQREMMQQQQQQGVMAPTAGGGGGGMNGRQANMSLLNSADLVTLLPLDAAAAAGSGGVVPNGSPAGAGSVGQQHQQQQQDLLDKQNSFMQLLEGISSLPQPLDGNVDSLLNPADNPLLNRPIPEEYNQQQLQLRVNSNISQGSGGSGAPYSPGGGGGPSSSFQQHIQQHAQQQQQHDGMDDLPDDYAAFLVDEDDLAAVAQDGAAGHRKRVMSGAGAGISSCSLDLRKLSDMLMGGSSMQLLEGSAWHKICRDVSFTRAGRSGPAAFGGAGAGGAAGSAADGSTGRHAGGGDTVDDANTAAGAGGGARGAVSAGAGFAGPGQHQQHQQQDDEDDDMNALLGLREMSITH